MERKSTPEAAASARPGPVGTRVTIRDVARLAGTSNSTVSQVMSGNRPVKASTARRVRRAAEELAYQPDGVARAMRTRHQDLLGLILPDIANPFFPLVARGAGDAAADAGYNLILGNTDLHVERELQYVTSLAARRVSGILFMPGSPEAVETLVYLRRVGMPFVLMDESLEGDMGGGVFSDNVDGGYQAGRHLVGLGCRRLVYIGGPLGLPTVREREAGFAIALAEFDLKVVAARYGPYRTESGYDLTFGLLSSGIEFDGIFAADDLLALGAIHALTRAARRIPDDVAVCGFDGIAGTELWTPSLTTVVQASYALGATGARLLLQHLSGEIDVIPRAVLPVTLVPRTSSARKIATGSPR